MRSRWCVFSAHSGAGCWSICAGFLVASVRKETLLLTQRSESGRVCAHECVRVHTLMSASVTPLHCMHEGGVTVCVCVHALLRFWPAHLHPHCAFPGNTHLIQGAQAGELGPPGLPLTSGVRCRRCSHKSVPVHLLPLASPLARIRKIQITTQGTSLIEEGRGTGEEACCMMPAWNGYDSYLLKASGRQNNLLSPLSACGSEYLRWTSSALTPV